MQIADIGTGSGCIAIALAHELPQRRNYRHRYFAPSALEVAQRNAARHKVADRIWFLKSDLFEALCREETFSSQRGARWRDLALPHKDAGWQPARRNQDEKFNAIVSNPPYISLGEAPELQIEVRAHEPRIALFAGEDGFAIYTPLIRDAANFLRPGAVLILELGHDSLGGIQQRMAESGAWTDVEVAQDLARIPRVISARRS